LVAIWPSASIADHPPGTVLAGIPWRSAYTELTLWLINPTRKEFTDIDIVVRPNRCVTKIGQLTNVPDVEFDRGFDLEPKVFAVKSSGEQLALPIGIIAAEAPFRIRCRRLGPKRDIRLTIATVTVREPTKPETNHRHPAYRQRWAHEEAGGFWIGQLNTRTPCMDPRIPRPSCM
jgi:hypothetical protein